MFRDKIVVGAVAIIALLAGFVIGATQTPSSNFAGTTNFDDLAVDSLTVGQDSTATYIYIGAGDGCTALYAAASSTLTTQATSSSFCN